MASIALMTGVLITSAAVAQIDQAVVGTLSRTDAALLLDKISRLGYSSD